MAYTKYSLTPANNNATPPDGAPEGMLPSAVNDTMRDMMAQIRDCGDGIRDGTYTMTAPKITGGTITGSTINNSAIGGTTANSGAFTTLSASGVATFSAGTVSAPAITTSGDTNTGIYFPAADTIAFTEGGAEAMRIDSSGNVGIGVTPNSWGASWKSLSVNTVGALASTTGVTRLFHNAFNNDSANVYRTTAAASMYSQDAGTHQWFYAASGTAGTNISFTEAMRIDSSGNVGIGTSSPTFAAGGGLQVKGSGFTSVRLTSASSTGVDFSQDTSSNGYMYNRDNAALIYGTNNTERMRINSSGQVMVNTTSSGISVASSRFTVNGDYSGSWGMDVNSSSSTGTQFFISFGRGNTQCGSISSASTNSTSYTTSSDYRLKENIAPMTGALNVVQQLKPCTYNWKQDGSDGQGFIAHELQAVVPDAVVGEKDAIDDKGNPVYQGVDTSFLVATLTAAIQEQQAMIEELKQEVALLKSK